MKYIRGYWDCNYCNTKAIDGLIDNCTNCGKQKPSDTKYYMLSENDFVSAEVECIRGLQETFPAKCIRRMEKTKENKVYQMMRRKRTEEVYHMSKENRKEVVYQKIIGNLHC